jgi:uncharacterized BrkB/YihY/UPF0761 family membrane protein
MPVSFWIISVLVFILTAAISLSAAARHYAKKIGKEWKRQQSLNTLTLIRAGLPLCLILTVLIMSAIRYFLYQA